MTTQQNREVYNYIKKLNKKSEVISFEDTFKYLGGPWNSTSLQ